MDGYVPHIHMTDEKELICAAYKWSDIESAPRDGTPILAYCKHTEDVWVEHLGNKYCNAYGFYSEGIPYVDDGVHVVQWQQAGIGEPDWWFDYYGEPLEIVANPTHWMPLPQPPKENE